MEKLFEKNYIGGAEGYTDYPFLNKKLNLDKGCFKNSP